MTREVGNGWLASCPRCTWEVWTATRAGTDQAATGHERKCAKGQDPADPWAFTDSEQTAYAAATARMHDDLAAIPDEPPC